MKNYIITATIIGMKEADKFFSEGKLRKGTIVRVQEVEERNYITAEYKRVINESE